MGKRKILKQKKQVLVNGEWVDTRSYRYVPYCDGCIPCVIIRDGKKFGNVRVRTVKITHDAGYKIHKISLDSNGYGYLQLESNDIVQCV